MPLKVLQTINYVSITIMFQMVNAHFAMCESYFFHIEVFITGSGGMRPGHIDSLQILRMRPWPIGSLQVLGENAPRAHRFITGSGENAPRTNRSITGSGENVPRAHSLIIGSGENESIYVPSNGETQWKLLNGGVYISC